LGIDQKTSHNHLGKMPALANLLNADLSQGYTVAQVAQKEKLISSSLIRHTLTKKQTAMVKKVSRVFWYRFMLS